MSLEQVKDYLRAEFVLPQQSGALPRGQRAGARAGQAKASSARSDIVAITRRSAQHARDSSRASRSKARRTLAESQGRQLCCPLS